MPFFAHGYVLDVTCEYKFTNFSVNNKMQSETADFASATATWRTGRDIRIVFDSGPFASHSVMQENRKYMTYRTAVRRGPSQGRGNTYRTNLVKFEHVVSEMCERTNRQSNIHTR